MCNNLWSSAFQKDIKPANLLINEFQVLKIADFGLARLYSMEKANKCYSPQVATRWYRAPEILWGTQIYGPAIDLWATGCVFAEMLRGVPLFAVSAFSQVNHNDFIPFIWFLITDTILLCFNINSTGNHRHRTISPRSSHIRHTKPHRLAGSEKPARLQ